MGCCSSSSIEDLHEDQRRSIIEICDTTLNSSKPRSMIAFVVPLFKGMRKSQEEIYDMMRTDQKKLSLFADRPAEVDGSKTMPQTIDNAEKSARMFTLKKYGDDFKKNSKLGISSDSDLKAFVQAAVRGAMTKALHDRIAEIYEPESFSGDHGDNNNEPTPNLSPATKTKSGSNLKSSESSKAVSAQNEKNAKQQHHATTANNKSSASSSSPATKTTTTTATTTKTTTVKRAEPKPKPVFEPRGPPPPRTGPANPDNVWATCDDCDYYWNEYKELYYDPVKKLFFDFHTEEWMAKEPRRK